MELVRLSAILILKNRSQVTVLTVNVSLTINIIDSHIGPDIFYFEIYNQRPQKPLTNRS